MIHELQRPPLRRWDYRPETAEERYVVYWLGSQLLRLWDLHI